MRRRPIDTYKRLPVGRLRLSRLLWVIVACGCVWSVVSAAILFLGGVSDASRHKFVGSLSPIAAPVSVSIPKGTYLKEILVARNEAVYAGQTVALLDVAAMNAHVQHLETQLQRDSALRDCLLRLKSKGSDFGSSAITKNGELKKNSSCAAETEALQAAERAQEEALRLLQADQALLEQLSQVLQHAPEGESKPQLPGESVRQILSVQFARNRLVERKLKLESQNRIAQQDIRRDLEKRLADLTKTLRMNADTRRTLRSLVEEPRLLAPESGQVVRLRRFPIGHMAVEDTEFLEIRPSDSQGYAAKFVVAEAYREFVRQGQSVTMKLVGMSSRAPTLHGEISHFETTDVGLVHAHISLRPESVVALDDPSNGIALRGDSTSAVIQIEFASHNALQTVKVELTELLNGLGIFPRQLQAETIARRDVIPTLPLVEAVTLGDSVPGIR